MLLTLDGRLYKKKTMKILIRLASLRAYENKLIIIFSKKVTGVLFNYYSIYLKRTNKLRRFISK